MTEDGGRKTEEIGGPSSVIRPPKAGTLNDDLQAWLYPDPNVRAEFELFDGTKLIEGEKSSNRKIEWKVFRS
jgi:hypothetical protein